MIRASRKILATFCGCLALLGALCPAGCGGRSTPPTPGGHSRQWGGGVGTAVWNRLKELNPRAELQAVTACYGIVYGITGSDDLAFVILADFEGSCNPRTWGTETGLRKYEGRLQGADGRKVEWQCETADGKTGQMSINGSAYDLGKGPLVLVSTRGGQVQVRQVQRDLGHVKPDSDSLERLLRDDPDVGAFLAQTPEPK
jgi:hypothetical protein